MTHSQALRVALTRTTELHTLIKTHLPPEDAMAEHIWLALLVTEAITTYRDALIAPAQEARA